MSDETFSGRVDILARHGENLHTPLMDGEAVSEFSSSPRGRTGEDELAGGALLSASSDKLCGGGGDWTVAGKFSLHPNTPYISYSARDFDILWRWDSLGRLEMAMVEEGVTATETSVSYVPIAATGGGALSRANLVLASYEETNEEAYRGGKLCKWIDWAFAGFLMPRGKVYLSYGRSSQVYHNGELTSSDTYQSTGTCEVLNHCWAYFVGQYLGKLYMVSIPIWVGSEQGGLSMQTREVVTVDEEGNVNSSITYGRPKVSLPPTASDLSYYTWTGNFYVGTPTHSIYQALLDCGYLAGTSGACSVVDWVTSLLGDFEPPARYFPLAVRANAEIFQLAGRQLGGRLTCFGEWDNYADDGSACQVIVRNGEAQESYGFDGWGDAAGDLVLSSVAGVPIFSANWILVGAWYGSWYVHGLGCYGGGTSAIFGQSCVYTGTEPLDILSYGTLSTSITQVTTEEGADPYDPEPTPPAEEVDEELIDEWTDATDADYGDFYSYEGDGGIEQPLEVYGDSYTSLKQALADGDTEAAKAMSWSLKLISTSATKSPALNWTGTITADGSDGPYTYREDSNYSCVVSSISVAGENCSVDLQASSGATASAKSANVSGSVAAIDYVSELNLTDSTITSEQLLNPTGLLRCEQMSSTTIRTAKGYAVRWTEEVYTEATETANAKITTYKREAIRWSYSEALELRSSLRTEGISGITVTLYSSGDKATLHRMLVYVDETALKTALGHYWSWSVDVLNGADLGATSGSFSITGTGGEVTTG